MKDTNHPPPENQSSLPTLQIDYEHYQQFLDGSDLSEEEKKQFIDTLWSIIVSFVDLGFGIHPVQQACEQPLDLSKMDLSDVLGLTTSAQNEEVSHPTNKNKERSLYFPR